MAEKQFAYYEFNAQKKNIEKGTLLFIDGENIFVKQDIIPNINVGEIGATRLYFLLPYGTYTGLNPFFTIRNPKGWTSGLIAGVKITLNTTEPKTYSAVYIDLDKIGYTKIGGLHAIGLGFLENGSFITYDAVTYTVDDGVNNYENTSADVYEEIYSSIENTFIAYADRVIQAETDILNHEGRIADIETTEIPRIDSDIEDLQNEKVNKAGDTMEGSLDFDYKYAIYGLVELFVKTIASPNGRISFDNNRITDLGLALDEFDAVNLGQLLGKLTALKTGYNLWSGVNIFTKPVTIPNGETDKHAVNKSQLETKVDKSQLDYTNTPDTVPVRNASGRVKVSTAQYADEATNKGQLDLKEDKANKGATNGYAPLVGGVIPAAYVPNAYDHFIEVATYADLPVTGQTGFSYTVVADETSGNNTSNYRWTGSVYTKISEILSAAELKTLYESNADTNAYTDDEKTHLTNLPAEAYSKTELDAGQLDNRYYTETEIAEGVPIVKATTHIDTPKVILATGVYIQYNAVDGSIDFVIE